MLGVNAFQKLLVLLPLAYQKLPEAIKPSTEPTRTPQWSYDDTDEWSGTCETGRKQSPMAIKASTSIIAPMPSLIFSYYDVPLASPLTLENKGYTINIDIPKTRNGNRPFISGGMMKGKYEATSVHFHWGSPDSEGSEHFINGEQFDMEMHFVHKNVLYNSTEQAMEFPNGLAVLGIMFRIVEKPDRIYPGLNKIFNKLPRLKQYKSNAFITSQLTLGQLLGDLNSKRFYTYKGSLTTPPCSETVTWHVFPEPLVIGLTQAAKFWDLLDSHGRPLVDNFRPLQPRNGRPVFYRVGAFSTENNVVFLPYARE